MSKAINLFFRFRYLPGSLEHNFLAYIKTLSAANDLIFQAVYFWYFPEFCQVTGLKKGKELKEVVRNLIWTLESRIQSLRLVYNIEPTALANSDLSYSQVRSSAPEQLDDAPEVEDLDHLLSLNFNVSGF